jgi:metacaspase-1
MNRALLVGVNNYKKQSHLDGCINDTTDVRKALLDHATVEEKDIKILTDADATKAAILDELRALVKSLDVNDCGYFHFSGHGVRMPSADEAEPDSLDEVLCPYEFDWTNDTAITDNEVLDVLKSLKLGARLILTIDSCHSGDMLRVLAPTGHPRTIPPPAGLRRTRGSTRIGFRAAGRAPNVAVVSACSPWQTAADTTFAGRANGAFSYFFLKALENKPSVTSLADITRDIEDPLRPYEMTPVAENGATPYFPAPVRSSTRASGTTRNDSLAPSIISARGGVVVFEQSWFAEFIGQSLGVGVRVTADNAELTAYITAQFMGSVLASPPVRVAGDMSFPVPLGFMSSRLLISVSDWSMTAQAIDFVLQLDLVTDLPFVPRLQVGRAAVHVDVLSLARVPAPVVTSPADLLALLTLQQMSTGANFQTKATRMDSRGPSEMRGYRDPLIQVVAAGVAKWGPNWREDRVIRPFAEGGRPRMDGVIRHSVEIGPQRGAGNVYVVGWLSDQETDFDFILHMGNNFFGGWGEIDWRVQGTYADINPFPRAAADSLTARRIASAHVEQEPRDAQHNGRSAEGPLLLDER